MTPQQSPPTWHTPAMLVLVAASRLLLIPPKVMGGDGPDYINALKLDTSYSVPPPGNIGYVLCAKAVSLIVSDLVTMYALVATGLSCLGAYFILKLTRLLFSPSLALATALCVMTSAQVWYHGVIMQSYIVWLAMLPTIAYFCVQLASQRDNPRWGTLIAAACATGLSTILRPDMVVFAGPLLGAGLIAGRARLTMWVASGAICAACCAVWFFATAHVLGSTDRYLELVNAKHAWHETYSVQSRGLFEGLGRNTVKYFTFMLWTAHLALPLAAFAAFRSLRQLKARWRGALLALAWVAPSLYFSWIIFTGNAGLVLPALPLVYIAAATWLTSWTPTHAARLMFALAGLNAAQFLLTPIPTPTDQRTVLLTHMFFGYTATGLRRGYTYELSDFGIDKSLGNTMRQFLHPQPVPKLPFSNSP